MFTTDKSLPKLPFLASYLTSLRKTLRFYGSAWYLSLSLSYRAIYLTICSMHKLVTKITWGNSRNRGSLWSIWKLSIWDSQVSIRVVGELVTRKPKNSLKKSFKHWKSASIKNMLWIWTSFLKGLLTLRAQGAKQWLGPRSNKVSIALIFSKISQTLSGWVKQKTACPFRSQSSLRFSSLMKLWMTYKYLSIASMMKRQSSVRTFSQSSRTSQPISYLDNKNCISSEWVSKFTIVWCIQKSQYWLSRIILSMWV